MFSYSNHRALTIGIEDYEYLNPLKYCIQDAKAISEALSEYNCLFSCMTALNEKATSSQIRQSIKKMFEGSDDDAIFILFFAGHGITVNGSTFPVTHDADQAGDPEAGLEMSVLVRTITNLLKPKQTFVFILDCCHSGALGIENATVDLHDIQSNINSSRGLILMAATEADAQAKETDALGMGVFSNILFEGLQGEAARGCYELPKLRITEYSRGS